MESPRMIRRLGAMGALAIVLAMVTPPAPACTGQDTTVRWLADQSASVVVCEVVRVESDWTDARRSIESRVEIRPIEFIKGAPDERLETVSMTFPGGTVGDTTLRLCCAPNLEAGQRWVIFLLPEYRTHPAAAMGQGMFRLVPDEDGVLRVKTASGVGVAGVGADGAVTKVATSGHAPAAPGAIRVKSGGISVRPPTTAPNARAITLDEFIAQVRPMIDASRAHQQAAFPARRIPTELRAVPLQSVPREDRSSPEAPSLRTPRPERAPDGEETR